MYLPFRTSILYHKIPHLSIPFHKFSPHDLDVRRLNLTKKKGKLFPQFYQNPPRVEIYELSLQELVGFPLAAEPVEATVELTERILRQVAGARIDLARGVDNNGESVAIIAVDEMLEHGKPPMYCGRSQPYFYDTIIPHFTPFVNPHFSMDLDVRRLNS